MKIAFCSCSNINMQMGYQPIWLEIQNKKPDLLLLLGDNVYMGAKGDVLYDGDLLKMHYQQQLEEPHFKQLLAKVPYLAVWDNHDFGLKANHYASELTEDQIKLSRKLFDKYLKKDSLVPAGDEIYCHYDKEDVRIIMLDVRSKQTNPEDSNPTLLGTDQENFLLEKMRHNGRFTLVCSGMPFSFGSNSWLDYSEWAGRFTQAMNFAPKPLFLGGSMHKNAFRKHNRFDVVSTEFASLRGVESPPVPFKKPGFYELISSSVGRNQGGRRCAPPLGKYGIIEIKNNKVKINLHSATGNNKYHRVIDAGTWELI